MIRRKPKTGDNAPQPDHSLVPSPLTGAVPPVEYRWKPGQSGNPSGRPKIIHSAYHEVLQREVEVEEEINGQKTKVKKTGAQLLAQSMFETANSFHRNNVAAAKELRGVVEPTDEEQAAGNAASVSVLTRLFMELMLERREKMANAIDVG